MVNKVHYIIGFVIGLINFGLFMYFVSNKMMPDVFMGILFGMMTVFLFSGMYMFLIK
jgi:di/tricarboxylate transporter